MDAAQAPAGVVVDVEALAGPVGSEAPAAAKVNGASVRQLQCIDTFVLTINTSSFAIRTHIV